MQPCKLQAFLVSQNLRTGLAQEGLACSQYVLLLLYATQINMVLVYCGSCDLKSMHLQITYFPYQGTQSTYCRRILDFSISVAALFVGKGNMFWFSFCFVLRHDVLQHFLTCVRISIGPCQLDSRCCSKWFVLLICFYLYVSVSMFVTFLF